MLQGQATTDHANGGQDPILPLKQRLAEERNLLSILAVILDTMPQIVTYHDTSHRILWANRTAIEGLGKPVGEIVGRRCHELWERGRRRPCENCPVDVALRTGCAQEAEVVGCGDGVWLVRGEPVRDGTGSVIGVVEMALDITKRQRDEQELRRRLQFEELVAGVSTHLAGLRAEEIEAGIDRALAGVGRLIEADRSYVYLLHDGGTKMSKLHEWCAEGIDPEEGRVRNMDVRGFPWGLEALRGEGVLEVPCVADLQGSAAEARQLLESISVKSLLSVPIMVGGQLFGFLGLSAVRRQREWPEDAAPLLKIVAEILASALERKRSADAMNERLAFETLLSGLSGAFVNLSTCEIDREIERWLGRMGEFLGIDRGTLFQLSGDQVIVTHSWAAPGLQRASLGRREEGFTWGVEQMRTSDALVYARIEDIPPQAEQEREYCRRAEMKSLVAMPLEVAGSLLGAVVFSSVRTQRGWPDEVVRRLRLVGQVFANALLRRRAEEALQASEEQFRSLFENAVLGIYRTTPDGHILTANPSLVRMLGYASFEELAERNLEEQGFHPGYSRGTFKETIESQGQVVGLESAWTKRDGTPVFVRENARAIRDRQGSIACYEGTVEDITELTRAENALRSSEQNYREIFNATKDAVLIHDPVTGEILDVNKAVLETYGYTREEVLQLKVGAIGSGEPPYTRQEALTRIRKAAEEGPQLFEWLSQKKNGDPIWQEVSLRTAMIGGKRRVLAVVRDITDRKKTEAQVQQHLAELTRAWHTNTLGEMASGLAHELNQPLCAIVNYSNGCLRLMRRSGDSIETLQGSIERIAAQAQRAADIIKRIRRLIARREPQRTELDLEAILANAVQMLRAEAAEHNVTVISGLQTDLPKIKGDSVEIEQVALNLMKNAIEAMSDTQITRRTLTISSCLSDNHVEVAVTDTGRGVSPELSEKIFESFFTTKPQGLGIGLSLSRRIIEAHGGRLSVQSQGPSGTTFRFTLPIEGGTYG